jgi:hypothetical protein
MNILKVWGLNWAHCNPWIFFLLYIPLYLILSLILK